MMYLDVIEYNASAMRFYQRNGFTKHCEVAESYCIEGKLFSSHVYYRKITSGITL